MKTEDIESQLDELGNRWPVPSVADTVQRRLNVIDQPGNRTASRRMLRWSGLGAVAAAAVALIAIVTSMISAPSSLYAQVKESIRKSLSVHLQITSVDSSGTRTIGTLWYSRELGVRGEMGDEVFIDNGKQQWNWHAVDNAPAVVSRRASRDGIALVADALSLPRRSEKPIRASKFDREIQGKNCAAYEVPIPKSNGPDSQTVVPATRVLVWQNDEGQILLIRSEQFDGNQGDWKTTRELSITYDIEVPRDKFSPQFPASTLIVDEDRVWADRFPVEKSLATSESGGLLFAVHELSRCENGSYYVISSVRATAEHLKKYPPKQRKLNLQTTVLDVAEQFCSATTQQDCHLAPLASSEIDGVHYLWWLATDRNYFVVEADKRVLQAVGKKMESELGRVQVPLMANYRGELMGSSMISTHATVELAKGSAVLTLHDVAERVRRDASLSHDGLLVHTFENATGRYVPASSITADQLVRSWEAELDWLKANDQLGEISIHGNGTTPPN
ncbi:MAG: hypothetical protein U0892_18625 [Pirellulales bacterium]